jgi:tetratricopeptide (TPR) repeat protein
MEKLYREQVERGRRDFLCNLGYAVSRQTGREEEAEAILREAIAEGVGVTVSHLNLGALARRRGDLGGAARELEAAVEEGDSRGLFELAKLLEDGPRDEEVTALYTAALEAGHDSAPAHLARRLWAAGELEDLEPLYRMALERGHGPAPALELACLLHETDPGREDDARELIRAALATPIKAGVLEAVVRQQAVSKESAIWALREALAFVESPKAAGMECAASDYRDFLVDEVVEAFERADREADAEAFLRERVDAGEVRLLCLLGWIIFQDEARDEEAVPFFERAIEAGTGTAAALNNLAVVAERRGDMAAARGLWEKAAKAGDGNAAKSMAAILPGEGHEEERERYLRQALTKVRDPWVPLDLACLLRARGDERTEDECRELIGTALRRGIDSRALRDSLLDYDLPVAAVIWVLREAIDRAESLGEDHDYGRPEGRAELIFLLGVRLHEDPELPGADSEALTLFLAASAQGHPDADRRIAKIFEDEGRLEEAKPYLEKGAERGDVWSLCRLAGLLDAEGDDAGAESRLRRAADLGDYDAFAALGRRRRDAGDHEAAVEIAREALATGDASAHCLLGQALHDLGRDTEAEESLRRGIDAGSGWAALTLGVALVAREDREAAEAAYMEGVELGDRRCMHNLATLYSDRQDFDAAEAMYRRAAEAGAELAAKALEEMPARRAKALAAEAD